jgi:hypothetical protein
VSEARSVAASERPSKKCRMKRRNGRHGAGRRLASGALPYDNLTPRGRLPAVLCLWHCNCRWRRPCVQRQERQHRDREVRALLEAALKKLGGGLAMTTTRLIVAALLLALAAPLTAEAQQTGKV